MNHSSVYDGSPWARHYDASLAKGLAEPPDANLPAMLASTAKAFATQRAFTCVMPNGMYGNLTYADVDRMSDDFAVYLREVLGLKAGARVAVQLPNCLTTPIAVFGVLKAGCILVNTNPLYTEREMKHQFNDSGAEALIVVDMFADRVKAVQAETGVKHVVLCSVSSFFPPVVRHIIKGIQKYWNKAIPSTALQCVSINEALAQGAAKRAQANKNVRDYWQGLRREDLALLQYTGGTTGVAKGAMLTHGNLLWNVEQIIALGRSAIEPGKEIVLTALPLYHIFAFTANLLAFYKVGSRNLLIPSPRPIQNLQRAFENYPVTWVSGVNTLYNALLNEEWFLAFPPKHLKAAIGGGAAMHSAVVKRWEEVTGAPLAEGYGLTESSPMVCFQPLKGLRKTESIGIPAPSTEVRLVNDDGAPVPHGDAGELIVRGPQVMMGYWQQEAESAKTVRDGWLYTGDVAVMDADHMFKIVDRKKDLIIVSGFNVYPNEVEDAISKHDKVMEAAVIGVPDAKTGEAVRAYVVKRDDTLTEAELIAHCRTVLTGYKLPAKIVFRDELPKTPIGKILRKDLRQEVLRETKKAA
jgi:long-chain acyl-CoA synthetase